MSINSEKFSLKNAYYIELGDKKIFKVSWKMTDLCPYSCSYCYMSDAVAKAKAKQDNPTQEFVEKIATNIDDYVNSHTDDDYLVRLHLIGGEPSIYDLKAVIDKVKRVNMISLATNFYRPLDYWKDLKSYCKARGIQLGIAASFHLEQLDTDEKRWDFCNKLLAVKAQMKAVVDETNIEIYKPYFDFVMEHDLGLEITLTRDKENRGAKLSEENQEYVDKLREYQWNRRERHGLNPYFIVHHLDGHISQYSSNISLLNNTEEGILDYTGFYCNAGENNVRINQKGNLLRSACRLCSMVMHIGNMLDKSSWIDRDKLNPFICECLLPHGLKDTDIYDKKTMKGCTCFNNSEMWRPGYNRVNKKYIAEEIKLPNYHAMYGGTNGDLKNELSDRANWPDLDGKGDSSD